MTKISSGNSKGKKVFNANNVSKQSHKINRNKSSNGMIDNICKSLSNQSLDFNGNAVIYTRVSTKAQTFDSSLDSQLSLCKDYCYNNNFNILKHFQEVVSARNINKQNQLKYIINNYSNINLIINEPTRFSRNMKDAVNLLDECNSKNIIVHFVQDNLVSNNNIDIKKIVTGVFDGEIESKTLGTRIKRSIQHRKKLGIYQPSISPYGYNYEYKNSIQQKKRVLTPNNYEQKVINLINKLYYGSNIGVIEKLIFELSNTMHELYNPKNPNEEIESVEYGNFKFVDIANLLNSICIFKRSKHWTSQMISKLINDIESSNSDSDVEDNDENNENIEL